MGKKMKREELKKLTEKFVLMDEEKKRIEWGATASVKEILYVLDSSSEGLCDLQVRKNRLTYGINRISYTKKTFIREILYYLNSPTCNVMREHEYFVQIPEQELVVGDIVHLEAGDVVPADVRLITSKNLSVDQESMTGDMRPVKKNAGISLCTAKEISDYTNLIFSGTNVISGKADAVVLSVGDHTIRQIMS